MTLKYRGNAYKVQTTSIDTPQTTTIAKYRGQSYRLRQSQFSYPKTNTDLMVYRGVTYNTNDFIDDRIVPQTQTAY